MKKKILFLIILTILTLIMLTQFAPLRDYSESAINLGLPPESLMFETINYPVYTIDWPMLSTLILALTYFSSLFTSLIISILPKSFQDNNNKDQHYYEPYSTTKWEQIKIRLMSLGYSILIAFFLYIFIMTTYITVNYDYLKNIFLPYLFLSITIGYCIFLLFENENTLEIRYENTGDNKVRFLKIVLLFPLFISSFQLSIFWRLFLYDDSPIKKWLYKSIFYIQLPNILILLGFYIFSFLFLLLNKHNQTFFEFLLRFKPTFLNRTRRFARIPSKRLGKDYII